jgi:hypothetical protein
MIHEEICSIGLEPTVFYVWSYLLLTDSQDSGLYIMETLKLCSVIVMVTPVTVEDKFQEDGDLIYAGDIWI